MPNIKEYNSPIDKLEPSQVGSEAYEIEGRHIGAAYNELGREVGGAVGEVVNQADQHAEQQDIANLSNLAAQTFVKNTASWNQTMSQTDPAQTDPAETQQNWLEKSFEPSLEDLTNAAKTDKGREWVQRFSNEQRMHFAEKTTADVSTASGLAVQSNVDQTLNNYSQAARLDPTALPAIIKNADATVEANIDAHSLTPDMASKLREQYSSTGRKQIAISAAMGAAEANPTQFKADLAAGKYSDYFTGEEAAVLDKHADGILKSQLDQNKAQEQENIRHNKEAVASAGSQIVASVIQSDGSLKIPTDYDANIQKLAQMPNVEPGLVKSLIEMRRAVTTDNAKGMPATTDPNTYSDFTARMALPQTDPNALTPTQIFSARAHGQLSDKDMSFFKNAVDTLAKDPNKQFAEKRFNDFLASMKPSFIPKQGGFSLTGADPHDNQRWYVFQHDARAAFETAYAQGKWQDVLDPHNGAFLGHMGAQQILNRKGAGIPQDSAWRANVGGKHYTGPVGDTKAWHDPKNWK